MPSKKQRRDQQLKDQSELEQAPISSPPDAITGVVVRAYGKYFDVAIDGSERELLCTPKGLLKRERRSTDLLAVGDRVWVVDIGEGEGRIEGVLPRERVLARRAPDSRDVQQILLANPDGALFVFALREPEPHVRMLDRFLVLTESQNLPAMVAVNKIDLAESVEEGRQQALEKFADYLPNYRVFPICAKTGAGLADLRASLDGRVTVIAGPSGVGKTSLLNKLNVDLQERTGAISDATGKGRHTTTATRLFRLDPDTFVADTPGIRALALHGVAPEELDGCYPELRPYLGECQYSDCAHLHEPGCAVRAAVEAGAVPRARYESYAILRRGDTDD